MRRFGTGGIIAGCVKNGVGVYDEALMCSSSEFTELSEDSEFGLCSYDMVLPDSATIYGRLFLGAWDAGLDNVADDTVSLMLHATEVGQRY